MPAFVGLDVSQQEAAVCFLLGDGSEPAPRWAVPNSQPGADALIARLAALAQAHAVDELRIGMEATSLYWWHLASALKDARALAPYRPQVYALNPKLVPVLEHVFTLLSLVYPARPLRIAYRGLHTGDDALRGTSLEYLESILPTDIRDCLWPFLDDRRVPGARRPTADALDSLLRSHETIQLRLDELQRDPGPPTSPGGA